MTAWKSGSEIGPTAANLRLHRQHMLTTAIATNEARTVPLYLHPPAIAKQVDQYGNNQNASASELVNLM